MNVGTVYVRDNGAVAADLRVITSGMVGATVRFVFDSSWDGYSKTLVWKAGGVIKDDTTASGVIPHEVLAVPGARLEVGVYGVKDGVVTPTLYAKLGPILSGADPSGDESIDPSLPVWEQLSRRIDALEKKGGGVPAAAFISHIDLPAAGWQGTESPFWQVVAIDGVTNRSRVTIDLSDEQLEFFSTENINFTTKNTGGVITVSCVGKKPENDYTFQVTVVEVVYNG